jgi:pimeloyl-ACP methyl ester carboxylesterase
MIAQGRDLAAGVVNVATQGIPPHKLVQRVPLPGLVIMVHGVNSDGEWFEQTEQGLCEGLLDRLGMREWAHLDHPEVGIRPVRYRPELHPDGRIDQSVSAKTFITDAGRSPVIRFRYGYRCNDEEAEYKKLVWLNELEAWGGGPFANGCSALPDLWGPGLTTRLFLTITVQNFNSVPGRYVYDCPPRAYYVHAAKRLADLVGEIRAAQPDCPITMLCHSQGNMIGMAAAFIGAAKHPDHVADTYILANPPYATRELFVYDIGQREVVQTGRDGNRRSGEVTAEARVKTLAELVRLVRARRGRSQAAERINREFESHAQDGSPRWRLEAGRAIAHYDHGIDRDNRGRVFLYCNPADQVIGVSALQGIGWQGLNAQELERVDPSGDSFFIRVWAEGLKVGAAAPTVREGGRERPLENRGGRWIYRYREDHPEAEAVKKDAAAFWYPRSMRAKFHLTFGPTQGPVANVVTPLLAPILKLATEWKKVPLHEPPPAGYAVPVNAPPVPEPIRPASTRGGQASFGDGSKVDPHHREFDEAMEDPKKQAATPAGKAAQQYEYRARVRQQVAMGKLEPEEKLGPAGYEAQVEREIERTRNDPAERASATDHSTILTNAWHSRKVVAYDLAIGVCEISAEKLMEFRKLADWRRLERDHPDDYFLKGMLNKVRLQDVYTEATIPSGIDTTRRTLLVSETRMTPEMLAEARAEHAPIAQATPVDRTKA